jgi:hypothetical protein
MNLHRTLVFIALVVVGTSSTFAQWDGTRPATEKDFIGYWKIVLIPDEIQKSRIKNKDIKLYSSPPCRFLSHRPNGDWTNFSASSPAGDEATQRNCDKRLSAIKFAAESSGQAEYRWERMRGDEGLFFLLRASPKQPVEIWKVETVTDAAKLKVDWGVSELKDGDLLVQLMFPRENSGSRIPTLDRVWMMVLHSTEG